MQLFPPAGTPVRDVLRVSKDRFGREKSPDDQHTDHTRSFDRFGWILAGPSYRDVGSASKYARKRRDDFDRLMADLKTDAFGAKVLAMWEVSRGSRREDEWINLIDLAALRSVVFWIEQRGRIMDPADPHDRRDLIVAAADAALESNLTSDRTGRGHRGSAEAGAPHGKCPEGLVARYNRKREVSWHIDESKESRLPWIRELHYRWGNKGEKLGTIAEDFKKRGLRNRSGGPYSAQHLRSWLRCHAYAALRVHDPERPIGSRTLSPSAKIYPAQWEAILDEDTWTNTQNRLALQAEDSKFRPGPARWLLGGVAVCHRCGGPMYRSVTAQSRIEAYRCQRGGHAFVPVKELDELTRDMLVGFIATRQYAALAQPDDADADQLAEARRALAKAEKDLLELKQNGRLGKVTMDYVVDVEPGIRERLADAKQLVDRLTIPAKAVETVESLLAAGDDVLARWEATLPDARRTIAQTFLTPQFCGQIRCVPLGRGYPLAKTPVEQRILIRREIDGEIVDLSVADFPGQVE